MSGQPMDVHGVSMKTGLLLKRFLQVAVIGFGILLVAALLRDRPLERAFQESAAWAVVSAAVYIGTALYYASIGKRCRVCEIDTRKR